ncbi:MAG: O-antigen ligase family protein [Syntrophales bacterium]
MPLTKTKKGTPLTNNCRRTTDSPRAEMLYMVYQYHIDKVIKIVKFKGDCGSENAMNGASLLSQVKKRQIFELLNMGIPILVGMFIFLNPYPHVTAIKEISFYGSALLLLTLIFLRKTDFSLRTPLSIPFLLFVIWSFCDLFFALNKGNSTHDLFAHLIKYLVIFYLLFNFFATKERLLILVWTIIISMAIYSAGMLIDFYVMQGYDVSTKLGVYVDGQHEIPSNIVGISTLFGLLLSLYQLTKEKIFYRRIVLTICVCATAIATLATQTRGAILAMIVSLLLSFPRNRKTLFFFFLFLGAVILVMPVKNQITPSSLIDKIISDDRVRIWYCFAEMIKDHPITGIGFGMQTYDDKDLINKYNERVPANYRQAEPQTAPHNLLVDITVRTGIIGLISFLYIISVFSQMGWRIIKYGSDDFIRHWGLCLLASFVAVFIQGQFENTMSGPPAIILYTIWGAMAILWRLNAEQHINIPHAVIN